MVLVFIILGILALGIGYFIALRMVFRRPTAHERAALALRRAAAEVDDLFYDARTRMEEAVGRRRPGERRIGDGLRSSWRDW